MTVHTYVGSGIEVTYDSEVCTHAGECVRGLPAVFDAKRTPWVEPDAATPEEVAEQIGKCPSGALQFRLLEG